MLKLSKQIALVLLNSITLILYSIGILGYVCHIILECDIGKLRNASHSVIPFHLLMFAKASYHMGPSDGIGRLQTLIYVVICMLA